MSDPNANVRAALRILGTALAQSEYRAFKARARDILAAMEGAPSRSVPVRRVRPYGTLSVEIGGSDEARARLDNLTVAEARAAYRHQRSLRRMGFGYLAPFGREQALAALVYTLRRTVRGEQLAEAA